MRRIAVVVAFGAGLVAGVRCVPEIRVCEIRAEENVCATDADCVLAFCATDCLPCPNAYARRQVEATWCLTLQGDVPVPDCNDGKAERCGNPGPPVCVYNIEPFCNAERKCDLRPTAP